LSDPLDPEIYHVIQAACSAEYSVSISGRASFYNDNSPPSDLLTPVNRMAPASQTLSPPRFTPTDRLIIRAARNL
jgi:hypothetical protein